MNVRAKEYTGPVVADWERCNHCNVSFVGWSVRQQSEHKRTHTLTETLAVPGEEEEATVERLIQARINLSARQAMRQPRRAIRSVVFGKEDEECLNPELPKSKFSAS